MGKVSCFGSLVVGIPLLWYGYAMRLIEQTGLAEFGLELRPVDNIQEGIAILKTNIISDIPEVILNYANFGLLLIGLFACFSFKKWRSVLFLPFLLWTVGLVAYHLIELSQMKSHAYYMLPYFPVLLPLAGYGVYHLAKKQFWGLLALLLFIQPILTSIRILPSRWLSTNKRVPTELYEEASRQRLIEAAPNDAPTIVGVDDSNCIYFYYLQKKGFGVSYPKQLINQKTKSQTYLEYYIDRGAQYLYIDNPQLITHPKIERHIDQIVLREGKFSVIKLK